RAFKSDISFLEKISMGATGTIAVFNNLRDQGHTPIELERGSRSFKIWKDIKIKRIRVPDILCVDCGKCVECRTKTKLEISMSHSQADPERGWDYDLDDNDLIAFVVCNRASDEPVHWRASGPIQYVSVKDLRLAQKDGRAILTAPKGAEEGFEMRIVWPIAIANASGIITSISQDRIQYRRMTDERLISLRLLKKGQVMIPLVREGRRVAEDQILATVVPVSLDFLCDKSASESHYIELLSTTSLSKRYMATKALASFVSSEVADYLVHKLNDPSEHIYVRLDAAASLVRQNDNRGYDLIKTCLMDEYLQNRLEAVIVLGEIDEDVSCRILVDTLLDNQQHPEIRAGAAWALGELRNRSALNALIESFATAEETIRIESARALSKLAQRFTSEIIHEFPRVHPSKRPGMSWALSKAGKFTVRDILDLLVDDDARQWIAYIMGTQDQQRYIYEIEQLKTKDPEVYFAVTVLWKIMTSWIWGLEEY
ncbi:HEAT repeat domain-containing protein, partial [Dehalococcoidia bacterium]|nr:HEAT repeat domain-containing protein [Dehalococcoidia bacterium]